ncbi:MAG: type II toxin-antitoxin system RelB/DinJ family antitoxin [Gordonibacter sp.]|uniref:type II toxin-antitoxin system RelB/DinJ family antitoxin n=1 Tax=Gordonibacter sp. TaxID=1968902 RepID=UPI002FC59711
MADAMVTARMSPEKKEAGNRMLEQLGTNASQAVNRLYDYVLEKKELPFSEQRERRKYTQEEIAEAIAWVDSIPRLPVNNRFAEMTNAEIKYERLKSRGYFDDWGTR